MASLTPLPYAESLLAALGQHTRLMFDGQDGEQIKLYPAGTFSDATSNQAIVRGELLKEHHAHILPEAVKEAQQLTEQGVEGAKGRDVASVAVDIAGAKLALDVFPHLHETGFVHTQTNPSAANSVEATIAHGKALVALYRHYGIPPSRLSLKIPSTLAGLQACAELEKQGLNTLATVVYITEQAVAAGEAGCRYAAAYVNPLAINFIPNGHVEHGFHGLKGFAVLKTAQKTYEQKGWKRTEIMSASLISLPEAVSLAGLTTSTLSPALLSLLAATPLTSALSTQLADSVALYSSSPSAPTTLNCNLATPEGVETVSKALEAPETKQLMKEALEIFGRFEMELRELAQAELRRQGDA